MDSVSIISASSRVGSPSSPAQTNQQADHGSGQRFDATLEAQKKQAEAMKKPAHLEQIKDQTPRQKNKFGIQVDDDVTSANASREAQDISKAKMANALNRIEASIASILTRAGISYPDVQIMPPGNIMVSVPEGVMEDMSAVLGVFIAEFDHLNKTSFSKGLQMVVSSVGKNMKGTLDIDLDGVELNNPSQVVQASIDIVAAAMGISRSERDASTTTTQNTLLAHRPLLDEIKSPNQGLDKITPLSKLPISPTSGYLMDTEAETPEDVVRNFLESVSKTSEFSSSMKVKASPAAVTMLARSLNTQRPDGMIMRLEVMDVMQQSQVDSLTQKEFESLISKTAAQGRPGSELATSTQAARFANLVNNQIKSASWTENRTKIQLAPKGLGDIEIDVQTNISGKIRATIRVENPMVLDMLRDEKTGLHELLESRGFDISNGDIEFTDFEEPATGEDENSTGGGNSEETSDTVEAKIANIISAERLDIKI